MTMSLLCLGISIKDRLKLIGREQTEVIETQSTHAQRKAQTFKCGQSFFLESDSPLASAI